MHHHPCILIIVVFLFFLNAKIDLRSCFVFRCVCYIIQTTTPDTRDHRPSSIRYSRRPSSSPLLSALSLQSQLSSESHIPKTRTKTSEKHLTRYVGVYGSGITKTRVIILSQTYSRRSPPVESSVSQRRILPLELFRGRPKGTD